MKIKRIYWTDSLRGLAIVLMIIFHVGYDLNFLEVYPIAYYSGVWLAISRFVQFSFLSLVGFSLYLSYKKRPSYKNYLHHHFWRAVKLFLIAMGVTLVTFLVFPDSYIRFGVLHLISVAIIVGALLVRYPLAVFLSIFPVLILGSVFVQMRLDTPLLIPFGVIPNVFQTIDYFPIFPWLAVVFLGILIAHALDKLSLLINPKKLPRIRLLEKMGQKSLAIYLIHQPILMGGMYLYKVLFV